MSALLVVFIVTARMWFGWHPIGDDWAFLALVAALAIGSDISEGIEQLAKR